MNDALRRAVREQEGREADAAAAIVDSQTGKTTEATLAERGYDGAKLITGRRRFILVDVLGLVIVSLSPKAAFLSGLTQNRC